MWMITGYKPLAPSLTGMALLIDNSISKHATAARLCSKVRLRHVAPADIKQVQRVLYQAGLAQSQSQIFCF